LKDIIAITLGTTMEKIAAEEVSSRTMNRIDEILQYNASDDSQKTGLGAQSVLEKNLEHNLNLEHN